MKCIFNFVVWVNNNLIWYFLCIEILYCVKDGVIIFILVIIEFRKVDDNDVLYVIVFFVKIVDNV